MPQQNFEAPGIETRPVLDGVAVSNGVFRLMMDFAKWLAE